MSATTINTPTCHQQDCKFYAKHRCRRCKYAYCVIHIFKESQYKSHPINLCDQCVIERDEASVEILPYILGTMAIGFIATLILSYRK